MKRFIYAVIAMAIWGSCTPKSADNMILIKGGEFVNNKSSFFGKRRIVKDFYIGKFEVTQKEWVEIMGSNPSEFKAANYPVETVSWYDCIEYCNKRSIKEGYQPYYTINRELKDVDNTNENDSLKWVVNVIENANGYRLPTEIEWEYAASGGQLSKSCKYSGSNDIFDVAWYFRNSGDNYIAGYWNSAAIHDNNSKTKNKGSRKPNELGIYDMSGNVREWCYDWLEQEYVDYSRVEKGGGWLGGEICCEVSFQGYSDANVRGYDLGFRVCRDVY